MSDKSIVDQLRDIAGNYDGEAATAEEAADMLEFLLGNFQMCSPKMNGSHSWRWRMGWPWTHAKGATIEVAVRNAMAEVEREFERTKNL